MVGDAGNCNADTACDGMTDIPNSARTACGKISVIIIIELKEINDTVNSLTDRCFF